MNDNATIVEKIVQLDYRIKNQRDHRGRKPFQFVQIDASISCKKLIPNNEQYEFTTDRLFEVDLVLRAVKTELKPLEKSRQRSTYEFCTQGGVSRNSDKFETKTYIYKR